MNPDDKIDLYTLIRNIRWRYQLDQFENGALTEVLKSVEQAKKEILREFAKPKKYADIDSWTDSRNEALLNELDQLTVGIKQQLGADVTQLAEIAYTKSLEVHNDIFSMGGKAVNVNMLQYAPEQIKAFLAEPVGGLLLSEWVNETYDFPLQQRLKAEMLAGQFRGEGYPKLAKRINELLDDAADNTTTMVRTWVHTANTTAQHNVMKANADILTGWRWCSKLENGNFGTGRGICLVCLSLDARQEVYPINGGPPLPAHPRCGCLRLPATKSWRDLGIPIDDLNESARPFTVRGEIDPITGKIERGATGLGGQPIVSAGQITGGMDGFFKSLDADVQRQTLGPRRWELWKAGKVELKDLVDKSGRLRLVKELQ
jgi:hypothetical protein